MRFIMKKKKQSLYEAQQEFSYIIEKARLDFEMKSCSGIYACRVENSGETFETIELFNEQYENANIQIDSSMPGLSYKEMMRLVAGEKALIGITYVHVSPFTENGENGYLMEDRKLYEDFFHGLGMTINQKNGDGTRMSVSLPLSFELHARQLQKTACYNYTQYPFRGLTYAVFRLPPGRKVSIDFHIKRDLYKSLR